MGRLKDSKTKAFIKKKYEEKRKPKVVAEDVSDDSMEDEIDKFHKSRDKIPLEDTVDSEEEFENPVLNLEENESEEEQDEEESDDDLPEEELDDMAAKIERQAKFLRQKSGILPDGDDVDDDDESDEDDDDDGEKLNWGKKKRSYYSADNVDYEIQSSDEEGPALEEAEARRMQKKMAESLRPEDFDQDLEEADTLEKLVEQSESEKPKQKTRDDVPIEKVNKDLSSLSKDEKLQVVMSNAPELVALQTELKEVLHELEHSVQPLLKKLETEEVPKQGKIYAEVKHKVLLSYCQSIVFYFLLKAEGRSVCDHPVIARLVEIRTLLEKVRALDKRIQPQVDKLMSLEPGALQRKKSTVVEKNLNGLPNGEALSSGEQQQQQQAAATTTSSPDKREEFIGEESKNMLREMKRLEEKAKRDRLLERAHLPGLKAKTKTTATKRRHGGGLLDDLDDEVADDANGDLQPRKMLQVISEAGRKLKKPKISSGDVDLPVKENIGERRRKREDQVLRQGVPSGDGEAEEESHGQQPEDELYTEAKKRKLAKEAAKQAAKTSKNSAPKVEEETFTGKRLITQEMVKNRGLTPYRKKLTKNPRKRYKVKHGKAVTRRKGQVRGVRQETGPYGGEATGIRTNLSRSIRF